MFSRLTRLLLVVISGFLLTACETGSNAAARQAMVARIEQEPKGAYFVARRYYKVDYKFWGFVRKSGEPWSEAKLVVLNENQTLAPDRAKGTIGADNNYEYKLLGDYSGETVYEPASNAFYPEFVLKGYEVLSTEAGPIYREPGALDPNRRIIPRPY